MSIEELNKTRIIPFVAIPQPRDAAPNVPSKVGKTSQGFTVKDASTIVDGNFISKLIAKIRVYRLTGKWLNTEKMTNIFKNLNDAQINVLVQKYNEAFPDKISVKKIKALRDKCWIPARQQKAVEILLGQTPEDKRSEMSETLKKLNPQQLDNLTMIVIGNNISSDLPSDLSTFLSNNEEVTKFIASKTGPGDDTGKPVDNTGNPVSDKAKQEKAVEIVLKKTPESLRDKKAEVLNKLNDQQLDNLAKIVVDNNLTLAVGKLEPFLSDNKKVDEYIALRKIPNMDKAKFERLKIEVDFQLHTFFLEGGFPLVEGKNAIQTSENFRLLESFFRNCSEIQVIELFDAKPETIGKGLAHLCYYNRSLNKPAIPYYKFCSNVEKDGKKPLEVLASFDGSNFDVIDKYRKA